MEIHQIGGFLSDSNIYLIIDRIVTLIDAGTGRNFELVRDNLSKLGLRPGNVRLLINTHCHFDHSGGDMDFVRAGSEVAIHELEAELLRGGDQSITMAQFFGEAPEPIKSVRELHSGERLNLGEAVLEVIHTPGHTHGSVCLFEPRLGIIFSGDTVFQGGVGRTDLPTSSSDDLVCSLQRLAKLKLRSLYPGHGPSVMEDADRQIALALELMGG